jgi:outer membrane protein W
MKKLLFATAIMFAATATFAQDGDGAFTKGSSTISLGYGFISPYKTVLTAQNILFAGSGITSKYSSLGPIALTYENGITDNISVGLSIGYATSKNVLTEANGLGAGKNYDITKKLDQVGVVARGNYHFGSSAKFDPYIGLGLGYYSLKYKTTSNDPTDSPADLALLNIAVPGAFGFTGQVGAKYYFSSNIAAYAELGYLVGSFAQIGVTAKF